MQNARAMILTVAQTLTLALLPAASAAQAQMPVCPSVAPDEKVVVSCRPFSLFPTARFLADFSIDHLLKPAPPAFSRSVFDTVQMYAGKELLDHPAWKKYAASLPPLRFQQLDRTTGTMIGDFTDAPLERKAPLDQVDGKPLLTVRLPRVLQGGYWRGPDVLQMAFWEGQRAAARLEWPDGRATEGEIACVSMTPEGVLLRFAAASTPPLLMLFQDCAS